MPISNGQLIEVLQLINQGSADQRRTIVESIILQRTAIENIFNINPAEMQQVLNDNNVRAAETPFVDLVKMYIKNKLEKGLTSNNKKKFSSMGFSEDQQDALNALQRQTALLDIVKKKEEVLELRQKNKIKAEDYISIEILMPVLSLGLGNIANQLRALGMFHPSIVPEVNECIEGIMQTGKLLISESKQELDYYLKEYMTMESEWQTIMDDLQKAQEKVLSLEINSSELGVSDES